MKKLLLLLFAGICVSTYAEGKRSIQDIQINEAIIPARPVRPRFETDTHTESQVNYDKLSVDVDLNYYMGDLTVKIVDPSGAPVYETTANSDVTASISMPIPEPGNYSISIEGDEYQAGGEFTIQ